MLTTETLADRAEPNPLGGRRDFRTGLLVAMAAVLLVCAGALPRFAELEAFGQAVFTGGVAVAAAGGLLCGFKRTRSAGLGTLVGATLGLTLCWALMILFVGILMR